MKKNTLESIMQRVEKTDTCWNWIGWTNDRGYGRVRFEGKFKQAHRIVYELIKGEVPSDLVLDHLCRNRACVNPDHLEPVTAVENVRRGEGICAQNAKKTHCKRGHEFSIENTYIREKGRQCKLCVRFHKEETKRRKKELSYV